ncbi:hypothetical protein CJNNKLLH_3021 [Methylorubrum thiocyanatum]|jgi:uncharacterized protein|nr:hypothetical protein CJNNKLLH_3021 [Methylorubrum thiocyanatum]
MHGPIPSYSPQKNPMQADPNAAPPALDDETLAFAARVFQYARMGHAEELAELFGQGLPANLRNDKGDSLLMLAAYNGQAAATRVILEAGGDPELANDRGQTPLAGAAFKGEAEIVRLLLEHGAQVDGAGDGTRTALMVAAMFDRTEIVELLLAHGADPAKRDAAGMSAADMARQMGAQNTPAQLERAQGSSQAG